jgi:CHASE2 domain-containing sensor protein/nitrogen-specific signal transduction histidine kinase
VWNNLKKIAWNWRGVVFTVPSATGLILAIRLLGWLQPLEWTTLDLFFRLRPLEPTDERIVIVGMEEKDIQKLKQWPISDRDLARLIEKIKAQKPRVIGLDIYRDIPVEPGHEELIEVFKTTPNLIGIEKVIGDQFYSTIDPPPVLEKLGQISSSDLILDGDGVLRRAFLFPMAPGKESLPSLGLAVALKYLEKDKIVPVASDDGGWMKLGKTVFYPFNSNDGGYRNADAGGYQTLLNYRGSAQSFQKISFTDVLEGNFEPNLMRDRIVLIGSQATSIKDYFSTPHSQSLSITPALTFGVEIQANLASQILSTVLNNRPLIKVLPDYLEDLWIALWVVVPAIWAWKWRKTKNLLKLCVAILIGTSVAIALLIGISYVAFLNSWWLPLAPTLLALGCSSVLVTNFVYISQLQEYNLYLEHEVESRIQDLRETYRELKAAQDKILVKEKLAALGTLVAGVSHELKNPLHFIQNFASLSVNLANELRETISDRDRCCEIEVLDNINEISSNLSENLVEIKDHSKRANAIVQTMLPHPDGVTSERTPTDINALLDSAIKLVLYSQQGKYTNFPIHLEKNYDRSIPQIELFDRELSRSLINILDNAYYAVYQKAQLVEGFRPLILVETENLKESVKIVIRDNGAGIPEDIIDKIFDPFFTTKPQREGTGLGLSIAHDLIVNKNRGAIELDTQIGSYTKFVILLQKNQ